MDIFMHQEIYLATHIRPSTQNILFLQARCRGYLVRREFHRKLWAVTKIQAQVRGLIARRQYRKLKLRVEAARLKEEEERALRKQMDKRKAKEIAEKKYKVGSRVDFFLLFECCVFGAKRQRSP